jgi:hypothetical protein
MWSTAGCKYLCWKSKHRRLLVFGHNIAFWMSVVCLLLVVRPIRSSHFQCRNYPLALRRPRPVKPISHTRSRIPLQGYADACQPAVMNSLCDAVLVDRPGLSAVLDPSLWYIGWHLCHSGEHSADNFRSWVWNMASYRFADSEARQLLDFRKFVVPCPT